MLTIDHCTLTEQGKGRAAHPVANGMGKCVELYWRSGNLAPHCGDDVSAPVPEVIEVFGAAKDEL